MWMYREHVDLGIGVVPIVNLEWIEKIHHATAPSAAIPPT